jgi:hypothetical protein
MRHEQAYARMKIKKAIHVIAAIAFYAAIASPIIYCGNLNRRQFLRRQAAVTAP